MGLTKSVERPPHPRRRVLRRAAAIVLIAVAVGFGLLAYRHAANGWLLRDALAELDRIDPGWRLVDLEAARAVIPEDENSALVVRRARALLRRPENWMIHQLGGQLSHQPPTAPLTDDQCRLIIDALELNEATLTPLRQLAQFPRGRHPIRYAPDGISTHLRHIDDMSMLVTFVLEPLLLADIHDGHLPEALLDCRCLLNLSRSLRDEPILASQHIRYRHYQHDAIRGLERVLGHGRLDRAALADFQAELATELRDDPWEVGIRGERASVEVLFDALQDGRLARLSALRGMWGRPTGPPAPLDPIRDWLQDHMPTDLRPAHAAALRLATRVLATARLPWHERPAAVAALDAERAAATDPVPQALPDLVRMFAYMQMGQARLRCAVTACAVERYRLDHGGWPASLSALVPALLPDVPADPGDGQPIRYRRLDDGVVIYSVGPDCADNGAASLVDYVWPWPDGADLGIRLWDEPHRRTPLPENLP
jgi:hypothetical protein